MIENYVVDTLHTAPARAVLLGGGDVRVFGFLYARLALGVRRDVVFVSPILLHYPWYRRRIGAELGFALPEPKNGSLSTVEIADDILQHGRDLFLTDEGTGAILRHFATYPIGTLVAVLPPGRLPPFPDELEKMNLAAFASYRIDETVRDPEAPWTEGPRVAYARPGTLLPLPSQPRATPTARHATRAAPRPSNRRRTAGVAA